MRLGNGKWETAKFNDRLQVNELGLGSSASNAGTWKVNYEFGEYDPNSQTVTGSKNTGNIARQTISFDGLSEDFVQTYQYDSLYRLKEANEKAGTTENWKQNFTYDRYGNRLTHDKFINGNPITHNNQTHPTIDPNTNRFNAGQDYSYDKVGNLISDADNRSFTFDGNNKQILVTNLNSQSVGEYFYDGNGKRVKKKSYVGGVLDETVIFVYSGGKLVEEFSTKAPPTEPQTKYVATDHLQSIRALSNQDGEIVSRRDFMPFGEELQADTSYRQSNLKYNSDDVRQKFTGYEKDEETGLDFAEARMYENRHARFTAVDPLLASGKSGNPQTFNRYVYVINSPLQYPDPDGLQVATEVGRIAGGLLGQVVVDGGFENFEWDSNKWQFNPMLPNNYVGGDIRRDNQLLRSQQYYNRLQTLNQESAISDGEAIGIGFKRFTNRPFQLPISSFGGIHTMSMNPLTTPSISDLTGFQPFSDAETSTVTWRDEAIAFGTEFTADALLTKGAGRFGGVSRKNSSLLVGYGSDNVTKLASANLRPKKGWFDVVAHGTRDGQNFLINGNIVTPKQLFKKMIADGYKPGSNIRLMVCYSGKCPNGSAQQISNMSGGGVAAPRGAMQVGDGTPNNLVPFGRPQVMTSPYKFKFFKPRKKQK